MKIIFLLGSVQALFLAVILLVKKDKNVRDKFLIGWMSFLCLHLMGVYIGASGFYRAHPEWFGIDASFLMLEGPFLYLYVQLATSTITKLRPVHLLNAFPYLFFTGYLWYRVHAFTGSDLYKHITETLSDKSDRLLYLFGLVNHLHLIVYLILSIFSLRSYAKRLPQELSYTEDVNLSWLQTVVAGLSIVSVFIVLGLFISDIFLFVSHDFKAYMIFTIFSFLPFYLSFFAIQQKIIYPPEEELSTKYEASSLSRNESKAHAARLSQLMMEQKPYLNGKLAIRDLATLMEIHPKELSQVINENFHQNFYSYINDFRVEEARKRIQDSHYDHHKLLAIGLDCGFNTKSSFNSIFKKTTGQTPSEFKAAASKIVQS